MNFYYIGSRQNKTVGVLKYMRLCKGGCIIGWVEAGINFAFSNADGPERVVWDLKESVLRMVERDGNNLARAARKLKNNKKVVLTAVTQNGYALRHASKRLRGNKEIVRAAVEQNPDALQFASKKLRDSVTFLNGKPVWK